MNYLDVQASHDSLFLSGNRFCINIDIFGILHKIKEKGMNNKESLSLMKNQLFYYFQNFKLGKDITNDVSEY